MSSQFSPAAGVVILKHMDGDYHVLCLKTKSGKYDLTKGIIDPGEDPFETALREAYEEANISEIDFPFGRQSLHHDACEMFVGITTEEPEIRPNPHNGVLEHTGYRWIPILDAVNSDRIKGFLQPSVMFAYNLIRDKQL